MKYVIDKVVGLDFLGSYNNQFKEWGQNELTEMKELKQENATDPEGCEACKIEQTQS